MAEKVRMVLKVDLQCPRCYKKIKKILCKFPQIRDQVYDEKGNTVTVTVVCCSPEKIRDKLYSKGGKVIESIEIKELTKPEKQKEPEKKKEAEKPKEQEKPKVAVVEKPKETKPDGGKPQDKAKEAPKAQDPEPAAKPVPPPEPVKLPPANMVTGIPPVLPAMTYYGPSYDGFGGGAPWHSGYGVPPPPQPSYDGYYGYGYPNQYGIRGSRCDTYFSEENPSACSIM